MSACLSPEVLARIASGDSLVDPRDEQHVNECVACARQVEYLRRCIAAGVDAIAEEALEVEALFAELEAERRAKWTRMVRDPRFHRPALVRRLLTLALFARERDTRLALDYSKTATAIVEVLVRTDGHAGDLRFDAWRYHSMLLREMGQYVLCPHAFAMAEEAAAGASDPELAQAIILLSRALFAIEPDIWEPEEGRAFLERAEGVFARRDPDRLLQALIVRGMLTMRTGDPEGAASIFANVLSSTPPEQEEARADALRNYLWAAVHAGRADENVSRQIDALETIDEARQRHVNVLRDRWIRGLIALATGDVPESIALLRDTMRGFEAKGHVDTAIRVGIDAVCALLSAARYDECVELARDLVSRSVGLDQREPTRRHALTAEALGYLRDAAQRRVLTTDLAQSVAAYVDRITQQRPIEFVPPMSLREM